MTEFNTCNICLTFMSFLVCNVSINVCSVDIKTEADTDDMSECPDDDKPSTGMFAVSDDIFTVCLLFIFS